MWLVLDSKMHHAIFMWCSEKYVNCSPMLKAELRFRLSWEINFVKEIWGNNIVWKKNLEINAAILNFSSHLDMFSRLRTVCKLNSRKLMRSRCRGKYEIFCWVVTTLQSIYYVRAGGGSVVFQFVFNVVDISVVVVFNCLTLADRSGWVGKNWKKIAVVIHGQSPSRTLSG